MSRTTSNLLDRIQYLQSAHINEILKSEYNINPECSDENELKQIDWEYQVDEMLENQTNDLIMERLENE